MLSHLAVALTAVLLLPATLGVNQLLDINKGSIVHLFEWKWEDIAKECEEFLGPKGFAAVQTSPPHENPIIEGRPWDERLQVVSYKLVSRSGNEEQLINMLERCNKVGVRVFAHVVINHMTANLSECVGVGGSECDAANQDYPQVPYNSSDFHAPCQQDSTTAEGIRDCAKHDGFSDLDQSRPNVRDTIVDYFNHLISIGFSGFMVDSATFMDIDELADIYNRVNILNSSLGLPEYTRPFIYQEYVDMGNAISFSSYYPITLVTDEGYNVELNKALKHKNPLYHLRTIGTNLVPDAMSVVSVDGYYNERNKPEVSLNYKTSQSYKMAVAFMLARGHGYPLILSSFAFGSSKDGPPSDSEGNILSPSPDEDNVCANGWVCQHRWRQIYSMVAFNKATHGTKVSAWWDNGNNQIAFSRGNKGFVAFNMELHPLNMTLKTELPAGKYCDVISGAVVNGSCQGTIVEVNGNGYADIFVEAYNEYDYRRDGVLAIFDHESSRLVDLPPVTETQPALLSSTAESIDITTETPNAE